MVQVFNLLSLGMNELIGFFNTLLNFKKEKYSLSSYIYSKYINQFETMFFGHFLTKLQPLVLNFLGKIRPCFELAIFDIFERERDFLILEHPKQRMNFYFYFFDAVVFFCF